MANIEKQIADLESEGKNLDVAYVRTAANIPIYTKNASYSTAANIITMTYPGGGSSSFPDNERTLITFSTNTGANTIAELEVNVLNPNPTAGVWPIVRRIPFSGGAQWIVVVNPNIDANFNRQPTNLGFMVVSMIPGTMTITDFTS